MKISHKIVLLLTLIIAPSLVSAERALVQPPSAQKKFSKEKFTSIFFGDEPLQEVFHFFNQFSSKELDAVVIRKPNSIILEEQAMPLLHYYCYRGNRSNHVETMRYLLNRGCSISLRAPYAQSTVLHTICNQTYPAQKDTDMLKLLIARKANIEARDSNGDTPLLCTLNSTGNAAALFPLLEAGANVDAMARWGETPLTRAHESTFGKRYKLMTLRLAGAQIFNGNPQNIDPQTRSILEASYKELICMAQDSGQERFLEPQLPSLSTYIDLIEKRAHYDSKTKQQQLMTHLYLIEQYSEHKSPFLASWEHSAVKDYYQRLYEPIINNSWGTPCLLPVARHIIEYLLLPEPIGPLIPKLIAPTTLPPFPRPTVQIPENNNENINIAKESETSHIRGDAELSATRQPPYNGRVRSHHKRFWRGTAFASESHTESLMSAASPQPY